MRIAGYSAAIINTLSEADAKTLAKEVQQFLKIMLTAEQHKEMIQINDTLPKLKLYLPKFQKQVTPDERKEELYTTEIMEHSCINPV